MTIISETYILITKDEPYKTKEKDLLLLQDEHINANLISNRRQNETRLVLKRC